MKTNRNKAHIWVNENMTWLGTYCGRKGTEMTADYAKQQIRNGMDEGFCRQCKTKMQLLEG